MRDIIVLTVLILVSFSLSAQTKLINNDDKDVLLMSMAGDIVNIAASDSIVMFLPANEIYYAYRRLNDDPQIVEKIGFCFLRNDAGKLVYTPENKVPVFIQNNSSVELLLEYGDMAIVMPPGYRHGATGLAIDPALRALVYVSADSAILSEVKFKLLQFKFDGQNLSAELN